MHRSLRHTQPPTTTRAPTPPRPIQAFGCLRPDQLCSSLERLWHGTRTCTRTRTRRRRTHARKGGPRSLPRPHTDTLDVTRLTRQSRTGVWADPQIHASGDGTIFPLPWPTFSTAQTRPRRLRPPNLTSPRSPFPRLPTPLLRRVPVVADAWARTILADPRIHFKIRADHRRAKPSWRGIISPSPSHIWST